MNRCPKCGLNMDLVGRVHNCNPPKELGKITLPKPSKDQSEYLRKIQEATGKYDPTVMVGGPRKSECPVCGARRKLKALQMKRYRAKRSSNSQPDGTSG